jgi:lipoprotein-anchoring transpeptidase ErfK/SrfK
MRKRAVLALAFVYGVASANFVPQSKASPTEALAPGDPSAKKVSLPVHQEIEPREAFPISEEDYLLVKPQFRPRIVDFPTRERPGTIIINTKLRYLYLVLGGGQAKRYGVGVGRRGFQWSGVAKIARKAKWPTWHPPEEMMERDREAAKWPNGMPGGPDNPLGARALYLYQDGADTLYRIHGTREPHTIGRAVSSGCVRMLNSDVADLFERAPIGAKVVVIGPRRATPFTAQWTKSLGKQSDVHWKRFKREMRNFWRQFEPY